MKFGYIGIDYKHADQDIRDRVSFTDNQKIDFLQKAGKAGIEQCFVLSTCNRSEVYFFAPEEKHRKFCYTFSRVFVIITLGIRTAYDLLPVEYPVTQKHNLNMGDII